MTEFIVFVNIDGLELIAGTVTSKTQLDANFEAIEKFGSNVIRIQAWNSSNKKLRERAKLAKACNSPK